MGISEKDTKLLWGRSGGRCALCKVKLTQDKAEVSESFPLGEQAHIVAESESGPRGTSTLSPTERNSYYNLILLCPTDHSKIDKDPEDYPIEKLHMAKAEHEHWVDVTLSQVSDSRKIAHDLIYLTLIDAAVEGCQLEEWLSWTSFALKQPPEWDVAAPSKIREFRQRILSAAWPGTLPELERALQTLSIAIHEALKTFQKHARKQNGRLEGIRFYKIDDWDEERYNDLSEKYGEWIQQCADSIFQATKAANWFTDIVRRDINPQFFAEKGKLIVEHGPYGFEMVWRTDLLEYTEEEKALMPTRLLEQIATLED